MYADTVSDDEDEDTVPDLLTFEQMALSFPSQQQQSGPSAPQGADQLPGTEPTLPDTQPHTQGPSLSDPSPPGPLLNISPPAIVGPNPSNPIDWSSVMQQVQPTTLPTNAAPPIPSVFLDDFTNTGPIFTFDMVKDSDYKIDLNDIPATILQMAYNKLFIPLSLLTTSSLQHIQFNDNLKFHKILFGNGVGKHLLYVSTFPPESALTESEFWQAY